MDIIIAFDLENEEGCLIDQIKLAYPIELDPKRLVIPNFSLYETYPQKIGNIIRLQFEYEDRIYDQYDVNETYKEFIDNVAMESEVDEPFNDTNLDKLKDALSVVFLER